VHENAGLFIKDDYVIVFIDDIKWNILRCDFFDRKRAQCQLDYVIVAELEALFDDSAIDPYRAGFYKFLEHCATVVGDSAVEVFVDSSLFYGAADVKGDFVFAGL